MEITLPGHGGANAGYYAPAISIDNRTLSSIQNNRIAWTGGFQLTRDEGNKTISSGSAEIATFIPFSQGFTALGFTPTPHEIHINHIGSGSNSRVNLSIYGIQTNGFYVSIVPFNASSVTNGILFWDVSLK